MKKLITQAGIAISSFIYIPKAYDAIFPYFTNKPSLIIKSEWSNILSFYGSLVSFFQTDVLLDPIPDQLEIAKYTLMEKALKAASVFDMAMRFNIAGFINQSGGRATRSFNELISSSLTTMDAPNKLPSTKYTKLSLGAILIAYHLLISVLALSFVL